MVNINLFTPFSLTLILHRTTVTVRKKTAVHGSFVHYDANVAIIALVGIGYVMNSYNLNFITVKSYNLRSLQVDRIAENIKKKHA